MNCSKVLCLLLLCFCLLCSSIVAEKNNKKKVVCFDVKKLKSLLISSSVKKTTKTLAYNKCRECVDKKNTCSKDAVQEFNDCKAACNRMKQGTVAQNMAKIECRNVCGDTKRDEINRCQSKFSACKVNNQC